MYVFCLIACAEWSSASDEFSHSSQTTSSTSQAATSQDTQLTSVSGSAFRPYASARARAAAQQHDSLASSQHSASTTSSNANHVLTLASPHSLSTQPLLESDSPLTSTSSGRPPPLLLRHSQSHDDSLNDKQSRADVLREQHQQYLNAANLQQQLSAHSPSSYSNHSGTLPFRLTQHDCTCT